MEKKASSACNSIAQVVLIKAIIYTHKKCFMYTSFLFHRVLKRYVFKCQHLKKIMIFTALYKGHS